MVQARPSREAALQSPLQGKSTRSLAKSSPLAKDAFGRPIHGQDVHAKQGRPPKYMSKEDEQGILDVVAARLSTGFSMEEFELRELVRQCALANNPNVSEDFPNTKYMQRFIKKHKPLASFQKRRRSSGGGDSSMTAKSRTRPDAPQEIIESTIVPNTLTDEQEPDPDTATEEAYTNTVADATTTTVSSANARSMSQSSEEPQSTSSERDTGFYPQQLSSEDLEVETTEDKGRTPPTMVDIGTQISCSIGSATSVQDLEIAIEETKRQLATRSRRWDELDRELNDVGVEMDDLKVNLEALIKRRDRRLEAVQGKRRTAPPSRSNGEHGSSTYSRSPKRSRIVNADDERNEEGDDYAY
ncbi:hypothetical protein PHYBOEH_011539 [Phytophthora boehmeriae]|uniref:HTH CENPB-type domain-containing protein n=1 Tax=Phytophthora boehmeriae TaxID=109152 RepID=A0A8T1VJ06_9STRA|nr:hypothetical protein PHYBOEH_011539 [Phytophthora boehmeriae]